MLVTEASFEAWVAEYGQSTRPATPFYLVFSQRHGGTEKESQLAVDDSGNAVFHEGFAEVQQISEFHSGQAEVG